MSDLPALPAANPQIPAGLAMAAGARVIDTVPGTTSIDFAGLLGAQDPQPAATRANATPAAADTPTIPAKAFAAPMPTLPRAGDAESALPVPAGGKFLPPRLADLPTAGAASLAAAEPATRCARASDDASDRPGSASTDPVDPSQGNDAAPGALAGIVALALPVTPAPEAPAAPVPSAPVRSRSAVSAGTAAAAAPVVAASASGPSTSGQIAPAMPSALTAEVLIAPAEHDALAPGSAPATSPAPSAAPAPSRAPSLAGIATTAIVADRSDRRAGTPGTEAATAPQAPPVGTGTAPLSRVSADAPAMPSPLAITTSTPDTAGREQSPSLRAGIDGVRRRSAPTAGTMPKSVDPDGPSEAADPSSSATVSPSASSSGAGPATSSTLPAGPATLASTASDLSQARPPLATTTTGAAPTPGDMSTLVDRLVEARAAARTGTNGIKATVMHGDFGAVSLRFRPERDGMAVSIDSADPGFARSAHAALAAAEASGPVSTPAAFAVLAAAGSDKRASDLPGENSGHARGHTASGADGNANATAPDGTANGNGGGQARAGTRWQEAADARGFVPARAGSQPASTPNFMSAPAPARADRTVTDGGRGVLA
jgi:Meckel syndrome type 1 protein